jgi:enoyl-CoA hydratase/carnithine racemase
VTAAGDVVLYESRNGAALMAINRPDQRNALSIAVLSELVAAVERARDDPDASYIVLTGAGDRAFCAGADLNEMGDASDVLAEHRGRGDLARLFASFWGADKPTIARVDGYCLAGGFGLALACDLVLATPQSVFGAPEVKVGLWPYMITLPLIRSMPPKQALRLMMTGERVTSDEAQRLGFVTEVVPAEALDERVDDYAATFRAVSLQAVALGRRSFYSVLDHGPHARLELLHASLGVALTMPDAAEGLAAFAAKRSPRWHGRAPDAATA